MSTPDVLQNFNMASMSDHGSVMDNLSFDDFDPSQGSLDFFEEFADVDKMEESTPARGDDVYAQLEQKEKDLILAAELGKALLERNEELTKRQDQMQQELADKMEEFEQERYHLQRRLEAVGGEYESKLLDLQSEISSLHKELANQKTAQRIVEKEKQSVIDELSEQNQKLVHQLKQASDVEEELNEHIQRLRDQVHLRRQHSLQREDTHVTEELQKEVQRLSAKRGELERRLHTASNDRDTLASSLKETSDRCMMLEKQSRELEQELQMREAELTKLRQVHNDTTEELEELRCHSTLNSSSRNTDFLGNSLLSELGLEMGGPGRGSGDLEEALDQGYRCSTSTVQYEEDIEYDGIDEEVFGVEEKDTRQREVGAEDGRGLVRASNDDNACTCHDEKCNIQHQTLQDVLNEVHTTLSNLIHELKAFQVSSSPIGSPHHLPRATTKEKALQEQQAAQPDEVRSVLRDLRSVTSIVTKRLDMGGQALAGSGGEADMEALEAHIEALRGELGSTQAHIELLQAEIDRQDDELKRKDMELCSLAARVRRFEHELKLASTSEDQYSTSCDETDLSSESSDDNKPDKTNLLCVLNPGMQDSPDHHQDVSSSVSQDEIIERLQNERDEAILRQSVAEQELFQTKADMSKLDDQLIGAIKQKVSLSEQLDQWQIDIHQLLDQRLKKQLTRHEVRKPDLKKPRASPQKRFPFWS